MDPKKGGSFTEEWERRISVTPISDFRAGVMVEQQKLAAQTAEDQELSEREWLIEIKKKTWSESTERNV